MAAGVLVAAFSVFAQRIFPPSPSHSQVTPSLRTASPKAGQTFPSPSSRPAVTPPKLHTTVKTSGPLTIMSEEPVGEDTNDVWSFPNQVVLTDGQLHHLNQIFLSYVSARQVPNYLYSLGGYQASPVETQVVLKNNRGYGIRIIDVHVVKSCSGPLAGTLIYAQGQGADSNIGLGFNLDSNETDAKPEQGGEISSASSYFAGHTVSIKSGASQGFTLVALAKLHSCEFEYVFTVLNGRKKTYQAILDGTRPFRISALQPLTDYSVAYAGGPNSPDHQREKFVRVNPRTYRN